MKKLFSILLALGIYQSVISQSVGIGTTTPNSKAILDLSSTNKGLLIPSMTTSQRFAISAPPNGLMVYDSDKNEFYHYNGTGWTAILNGGYWTRPITSRKKITNNVDSVGIGTNSPTEWLDVDGNIRSRNNVITDNDVLATGTVSSGGLTTSGNLFTAGTSSLIGNVSTYGNVNVAGKITRTTVTGSSNLLPVCMGRVNVNGAILGGSGNFSVTCSTSGGSSTYMINCTQFDSQSIIMVTPNSTTGDFEAGYDSLGKLYVFSGEGDMRFYFVVYNP